MLAPCLKDIPGGRGDGKYSLKDKAFRYNNRHVDLLANRDDSFNAFKIRTEAINFMRRFLIENEFLEVETPILQRFAGGASAKPFYTRLEKGNQELSLRIAPELLLKTLVVGGIERVFEIGKPYSYGLMGMMNNFTAFFLKMQTHFNEKDRFCNSDLSLRIVEIALILSKAKFSGMKDSARFIIQSLQHVNFIRRTQIIMT